MEYIAPIAIDLGARTTGVFISSYSTENPDPAALASGLIVRADPGDLTFMASGRRQARHMRRNIKRRKLAKKLVDLWLADRWPKDVDPERLESARRFLRGLMNRRGFVHFSLDEKIDSEMLDPHAEALEAVGIPFGAQRPSDWLRAIVADPVTAQGELNRGRDLYSRRNAKGARGAPRRDELGDYVKQMLEKAGISDDARGVAKAVSHIRECLDQAVHSIDSGHKPRQKYFAAIRSDLANRKEDVGALLGVKPDEIANLIGHIGNWNLPALRAYFHDPSRKTKQALDVLRFRRAWLDFFRRWTLSGESGERRTRFARERARWIKELGLVPDNDPVQARTALWKLLTTQDPETTIPPFEAQVNRRPPKCQSLLLHPDRLDRNFPAPSKDHPAPWRLWAAALGRAEENLTHDLDAISKRDAQAIQRGRTADAARWRDARLLQRVLDRSRERDPYKLRLLAALDNVDNPGQHAHEALQNLRRNLGDQHVENFLAFAQCYYRETRAARAGTWMPEDEALLSVCCTHPPHKSKLLDPLLGMVFSDPGTPKINADAIRRLLESESVVLRTTRREVRRKIRPLLEEFSNLQKQLGGNLREYYLEAKRKPDLQGSGKKAKGNPYAEAWQAYQWAPVVAERFGQAFGHDEARIARYANPYSLAQVYQLLCEDVHGFSSTCHACTLENAWRAQLDPQGVAEASRLPAEGVRPFDGALARLLHALASRIATAFAEHATRLRDISALAVPILIEENRFEFVEQLALIKKRTARQKQLADRAKHFEQDLDRRWKDRWTRIREDCGGLCPYCGRTVDADGDFDHIVSQAVTRDREGYSFDSEANLTYAHRACNQTKGRALYTLGNVAEAYLLKCFGTAERARIETEIRERTEPWLSSRTDTRAFHQLDDETRRAVRHALFVPGLRERVLVKLAMQNMARVNGTQRWFARELMKLVEAALRGRGLSVKPRFTLHRVKYEDVARLRHKLADENELFRKSKKQPLYSHLIDGALVLAVGSTNAAVRRDLRLPLDEASMGEFFEPDRALALLPRSLTISHVERRPLHRLDKPWHRKLFKDTLVGERFIPIGVDTDRRIYVGFSPENRSAIEPARRARMDALAFLRALWPVLNTPEDLNSESTDLLDKLAERAQGRGGLLWMTINRRLAFEHLQAHRQNPEDKLARLLEALLYRIQRVDLKDRLNIDKNLNSPTREDLLNPRRNKQNENSTSRKTTKTIRFDLSVNLPYGLGHHRLVLPARTAWDRLLGDPELAPHLGKKLSTSGDGAPKDHVSIDWRGIVERHFPGRGSNRHHRRMRQAVALPALQDASGGMRVRRKAYDGTPVFQLLVVEKGAYAGFARDPKKEPLGFDPTRTKLLDVFARNRNLTPDKRDVPIEDAMRFDDVSLLRTSENHAGLERHGIQQIEVLPFSDARRKVRMTITWEGLSKLVPGLPNDPLRSLDDAAIPLDKDQQRAIARLLREILGLSSLGPREQALVVHSMDDRCVSLSWTAGTGEAKGEPGSSAQPAELGE